MSEYTERAEKFLRDCGATINVSFLTHGLHSKNDKDSRDIYHIVIERGGKKMEFDFGQSLVKSKAPQEHEIGGYNPRPLTNYWRKYYLEKKRRGVDPQRKRIPPDAYSVLACFTKYEPENDVWEFAREFGYEINSRESLNEVDAINMAVIKEYRDVARLFGDVIDELREIY